MKMTTFDRLQKFFRTYWQTLIFPALYFPYRMINDHRVIVDWLGCGCPKFDEQGLYIENDFNANNFTSMFWTIIAVNVISISLYNVKNLSKWRYRVIYMTTITIGSIFMAIRFCYLMQWN